MNEENTFNDVVNNSFMDLHSGNLTIADIGLCLIITFINALFIFWIYRKTFRGVLYTHSYNVSLVLIALVTSLVIMTISTNLILSLGMVGALSIVRFRTAVKDPMDIAFMFWAIAIGIAGGAFYFQISITGSIFIGVILLLFGMLKTSRSPFLVIIHYSVDSEAPVLEAIKRAFKKMSVKSKVVSGADVELTVEVRASASDIAAATSLTKLAEVRDVSMVSYDGHYVS
ncbi:DUF4956 domain-containing protein [Akkermansiaceae bacterium]|nr:DUF4956 domain-containing protein [Akkermansiaceae bacterium]